MKNEAQKATTEFTLPKGTKTWMPTVSQNAVATDTMTDEYASVETESKKMIVEPTMELAPHPSATCAKEKMEAGCRALEFKYGKETTAKGEAKNEWGDYKNRLKEVLAIAYNPSTKKMVSTAVAQYEWDKQGRLRAEWDPRVSPALKTLYAYDVEGHVTAVSDPGSQPWLLRYGTIPGDVSTGRLLSAIRPSASTALGGGEVPSNTGAPVLSSTKPAVGTKITVSSNGTWGGSPLSYSYQWEDCNASGKECAAIPGAVNQSYYPAKGDEGHTLVVVVGALNGTATVTALSAATSVVATGTPYSPAPEPPSVGSSSVWSIEYQVPLSGSELKTMTKAEVEKWGQTDDPVEAAAIFPPDEPMGWPAKDYKRATVYYMDSEAHAVNVVTPSGAVSTSEFNQTNNVVERTLTPDNRVTALKEGSKSAEVSKLLDTKSVFNPEGTQLIETRGPQHTVKLSTGAEVQARNHVRYFYNENAPSGEMFDLVTRTTDGAEYEGKEADVRETRTSYSGQSNLGWKLRKPTSVTTDPAGLDLTKTMVYEESTGNVRESRSPAATAETVYPPAFSATFGSEGSSGGQLKHPQGVALDASGNVWVADTENNRVEEFSASGTFVKALGFGVTDGAEKYETCTSSCRAGIAGTGNGEFSGPERIAFTLSGGDMYVSDTNNGRVEELSASGEFVRVLGSKGSGNGQFIEPVGLTVDSQGAVWVADAGNNRVQKLSATGEYLAQYGTKGAGNGQFTDPVGVAISEGEIYILDRGNNRVQELSLTGEYLAMFTTGASGEALTEMKGIAVNPTSGDLFISENTGHPIQELSPSGKALSGWTTWGETHEISTPTGLAINATGKLYIVDHVTSKISEWLPPEAGAARMSYATQFGSGGTGSGQFKTPVWSAIDGQGNVWITDHYNDRVEEFSSTGKFIASYGKEGAGNGQFNQPAGVDINQGTGNIYVADKVNNRVEEISSTGTFIATFGTSGSGQLNSPIGLKVDSSGNVWVADRGNNRIVKFSSTGTFIAAYGSTGSGNGQFNRPAGITFSGPNLYITDTGNHRVQELSNTGTYISQFGVEGNGSNEFYTPEGIAADSAGNLYVADETANYVKEFSAAGVFRASFASPGSGEGQFIGAVGISVNPAGDVYVVDSENNRIEEWTPSNQAVHDTQTVYYTPKTEATVPACQNHPEWANLPCQTQPAGQPETSGLPNLPVTSITYNMWEQAETITETFGSTTRARKNTFDNAGRPLTSEETSTVDKAFPKVTDEYNAATGALEKQSTTTEGKTKTITSIVNTLGELSSYTDADGTTTTYKYDVDRRTEEVSDSKGSQIYSHDPTTGFLTKLLDSAAGTFTASYDVEGKTLTESYPNGMNANYTLSTIGQDVKVEYVKTTHCTSGCTWFSDTVVPSIQGETLSQTSTLSSETYVHDKAGRLVQTQETPAGKGCVTRIYALDEESNRRSLTTREPGPKGECATEGGTAERHVYDPANRLIDSGITYEGLGNTTNLPASDAGGNELTSSYYVDSQVASQTQNGETISYGYDPAGRTRETISSGKTAATVISHYDGPDNALSWTSESTEKWTRNIPGIGGEVAAIQTNAGAPVLQLHDLQGNIIATAALNETETKLLSTYNSTEFGVPTTSSPPKYSWLGADGIASELPSGDVAQDGTTYIPLTGLPLQTQPVELPLPINTVRPVSNAEPQWLAEQAGISGAEEATAVNEAKKAREIAEAPVIVEATVDDPVREGLASYKTTMNRAQELRNDAAKGLAVGLLADLVVAGLAEGGASYAAELESSAINLEACVEVGKNTPGRAGRQGTCFINENRALGVPLSARAEFCEYRETRQWGKKSHNVYYCTGTGEDVWAPWY